MTYTECSIRSSELRWGYISKRATVVYLVSWNCSYWTPCKCKFIMSKIQAWIWIASFYGTSHAMSLRWEWHQLELISTVTSLDFLKKVHDKRKLHFYSWKFARVKPLRVCLNRSWKEFVFDWTIEFSLQHVVSGLGGWLPDKSDVTGLAHEAGQLVDAVDLLASEAGHLPGPQQLVPLTRRPVSVESKFDSLDLLVPGPLDSCPVCLSQTLLNYFLLSDSIEQTDWKIRPSVFDTDLLSSSSLRVLCNVVGSR